MHKILFIFILMFFGVTQGQELNCEISVNSDRITNINKQIFKTLESSLNEFVNKTKWTNLNFNQKYVL